MKETTCMNNEDFFSIDKDYFLLRILASLTRKPLSTSIRLVIDTSCLGNYSCGNRIDIHRTCDLCRNSKHYFQKISVKTFENYIFKHTYPLLHTPLSLVTS